MVGIMKTETPESKLSGSLNPKVEDKDKIIAELNKKILDLVETLQRVQANFENYKKQVEKRCGEMEKTAGKGLICQLLPILDSFELAIHNKQNKDEFIKGMELVHQQFWSTLQKNGLKSIKCLGDKFDPYKHEALLKEPNHAPEDVVIGELQTGYTLNGEIIRFSKVKLSKGDLNDTTKKS